MVLSMHVVIFSMYIMGPSLYTQLQSLTRVAYVRENLGTELVDSWYSNMVGAGRLYDILLTEEGMKRWHTVTAICLNIQ